MEFKKLIIDLGIVFDDILSGISAVSLVESPAIELDFRYFNKETFDIDVTALEPYADSGVHKRRIEDVYSSDMIETILKLADVLGISDDAVELRTEKFATTDIVKRIYKYTSSNVASDSRDFCRGMSKRYFSREDIDAMDGMNSEFGAGIGGGTYSIFKFKGGVSCQHYWQAYDSIKVGNKTQIFQVAPESRDEIIAATAPRATQGRGYVKRPQRNLPPLSGHRAFSKMYFSNDEQRICVGPVLIPDMEIIRKDEKTGKEYYVKFSAESIAEIAQKFMKKRLTDQTNVDHNENKPADSYIYEVWITENMEDKANSVYNYNVPIGTMMVKMKIDDKETWAKVKSGELRGFSCEGNFADMDEIESRRQYERIVNILK